ncbi:hypothetical protein [Pectobacterium sp. A5351]|uniref:hypothetical protein n=1 Tax=Pectobacterium sp. A5351 TaxID=2914983 RepID=UPI00232BD117|nr:hypothetical protein [Pectobacterium sp. A5351]WCG82415.1 hypothetical protein O1Q74_16150 [Pectobacterium sp. A5351]
MFINQYLLSEPRLYELLLAQLPQLLSGERQHLDEEAIEAATYNSWHQRNFQHTDPMFDRHWRHLIERQHEAKSWSRALLGQVARHHLDPDLRRLTVQPQRFMEWQNWISNQSGFPVIAYQAEQMLCRNECPSNFDLFDTLEQTLGHRPIISPWHPLVEDYIEKEGLHEAHMHLNGTTFFELMWHHSLLSPSALLDEMEESRKKDSTRIRRFYAVSTRLDSAIKVKRMLYIARYCREWLLQWVDKRPSDAQHNGFTRLDFANILRTQDIEDIDSTYFPYEQEQFSVKQYEHGICELHFHIRVLNKLKANASISALEDACYLLYLLSMNLFQQLLVQRTDQYGFDQFQKFTELGPREPIEKEYESRFYQLHGKKPTQNSILTTFEGRFAPKDTEAKNVNLLTKILSGFWHYQQRGKKNGILAMPTDINQLAQECLKFSRPTLRLVTHFIKKPWNHNSGETHFSVLREDIMQRADILFALFDNNPALLSILTAFDAAANELESPPEVFSVLYRKARRKGIKNFTYHAGEDFEHLISGIRNVYEAITFLDLCNGDRIGHATAIGILPSLWIEKMPDKIYLRRGEWLENLLFIRKVLIEGGDAKFSIPILEDAITTQAYKIFNQHIPLTILQQFFDGRGLSPEQVRDYLQDKSDQQIGWIGEEFNEVRQFSQRTGDDALRLLTMRWFDQNVISRYEQLQECNTHFTPESLILHAQQYVQSLVKEKHIVIETLPTSNVRISHYESVHEHHVFRWMQIPERKIEGDSVMQIALGSDDQGIFVTDMKNEFYHLFWALVNHYHYSHKDALAYVATINENGRIYRFDYLQ